MKDGRRSMLIAMFPLFLSFDGRTASQKLDIRENGHFQVLIPYSTKKNWIERYPQAAPSLEYTDDNKTKFYKNPWCTSPPKKTKVKEGLKGLKWGESVKVPDVAGQRGSATAAAANNNQNSASSGPNDKVEDGKKDGLPKKRKRIDRRKNRRRTLNILRDNTFIADPDRDELHLEIWNYFVWFHARMAKVEEEQNLKDEAESSKADSTNTNGSDDEDEENDDSQNEEDEDEDNGGDTNAKKKPAKKWKQKSPRKRPTNGVNLVELKNMIEKLEDAFLIIHNTKHELVWVDPPKKPPLTLKRGASGRVQDLSDKGKTEEGGDEKKEEEEPEQRKRITVEEAAITRKTAPFLEEALAAALRQLVLTRPHVDGKPKRRSRKQPRMRSANRKKQMDWFDRGRGAKPRQFDEMYEKLAQFREKHGHCKVSKNDMDRDLAHWVRGIREKRARMRREQGIEVEVIPPGEELLARSLTQERIDRLDAIGFAWTVAKPGSKRSWEERFQELLVYYEEHGAWPSQSMVGLGSWLHKQRQAYTRQEPKFMKEKYQLLDDVGFEWTPRGNTRMSWDEGFEMLLEYGRENGHFQV
eukprot:CAMPEP_0183748560 /NCGR_PEP_ID=MMETSP0737-20130205/67832_1 /TAXON_ID=385413 /ORGANISM="Thalassiosira miniscula, Strain CCMP1093" /LENGTH=581 /DNA_ID=CAMNT_0025984297 /DNA_START=1144 /DNA_END=2887 /DNA_ORIENTATION=+